LLDGGVAPGLPVKLYRDTGGEVVEVLGDSRTALLNDDTGDVLNGRDESVDSDDGMADDYKKLMGPEFTGVKGQAAVEKLLNERQGHVKEAFYRDDIGGIDLYWGIRNPDSCIY